MNANPFQVAGNCSLRGDYSQCRVDYTVEQDYDTYTDAEHELWRRLYARQEALINRYAAPEFICGVQKLDIARRIPRLADANELLSRATGWTLVAVPGLIPNEAFFRHLAACAFPVSVWLRKPEEFDYLVEPDIFHDFFGHVPLLSNPVFADYMRIYGKQGIRAIEADAVHLLARLYWYMAEFGLIQTARGLRAFGAGILSSGGETVYSVKSPQPHRLAFDVERVLRTEYRIDAYQQTYFVLEDFEQLFVQTGRDLVPIYDRIRTLRSVKPTELTPTDPVLHTGTWAH